MSNDAPTTPAYTMPLKMRARLLSYRIRSAPRRWLGRWVRVFWWRVWGLGVTGEIVHVCTEDMKFVRAMLHWKLSVGPLLIVGQAQVWPSRSRTEVVDKIKRTTSYGNPNHRIGHAEK